ncbi:hypothetical protein DMH04_14390 [Kibdelosporangium aridum]|uniref:Uncharacterized protein n=1 Tax=Kibdelosporangium aridum TaxID=2030 RepID=A0A428ZE37_KIBAR|nr:hypothetical protein [Kibdelosporangium aridum]RSM86347.1 hypothetical protein DMH04_14390 [Kibdelosporangium aridum]
MLRGKSPGAFLTTWLKSSIALADRKLPRWREGPIDFIHRWRRGLAQHRGIRYWLLVQGPLVLLGLATLFIINGFVIGWEKAYNVTVQITSPWDEEIAQPWVAMPLSLAGWLVWPSVTGAVVGYVLADPTGGRARSGTSLIPRLDSDDGQIDEPFARRFEQLHRGRRKKANTHWVKIVGRFLSTDAVNSNAHSQRKMEQAVAAAIAFLNAMPGEMRCPICPPPELAEEGSLP